MYNNIKKFVKKHDVLITAIVRDIVLVLMPLILLIICIVNISGDIPNTDSADGFYLKWSFGLIGALLYQFFGWRFRAAFIDASD